MMMKNNTCFTEIKNVVLNRHLESEYLRDTSIRHIVSYFGIVVTINFILLCILEIIGALKDNNIGGLRIFTLDFFFPFAFFIAGLIFLILLTGLLSHIIIYIFGGRITFYQTIKIILYSYTPALLFFPLPFIALKFFPGEFLSVLNLNLPLLWSILLLFLGIWGCLILISKIKEANGFSWMRSTAIVFCLMLTPVICYYLANLNFNPHHATGNPIAFFFHRLT